MRAAHHMWDTPCCVWVAMQEAAVVAAQSVCVVCVPNMMMGFFTYHLFVPASARTLCVLAMAEGE